MPSNFDFRIYATKDGFNSPDVNCVFSDLSSYLWIGGADGLTKFDGKKFTNYNKIQGLNDSQINCITQNGNGKIYCGTRKGISIFNGFRFKNIKMRNNKSSSAQEHYVKCLFISKKNEIFAGCVDGLFKYDTIKNAFFRVMAIRSYVRNITSNSRGTIFITTVDGIFTINQGVFAKTILLNNPNSLEITALKEISDNIFWGSTTNGIVKLKLIKNRFTILQKYGSEFVQNILLQKKKRLIFTGRTGLLFTVKNSFMQTFDLNKELTHLQITSATEDYQGNIWLATSLGLVKMSETIVVKSKITEKVNSPVASMVVDKKGTIYFGTLDGLMIFNNFKIIKLHVSKDPSDNFISALTFKNNKLYVGTFSGKVYLFENNKFRLLISTKNINACIYRILPLKKDEIWVATGEEIIHYKNNKQKIFKISTQYTQDIMLDKSECLWVANFSRLMIYKKNRLQKAPKEFNKYDNFVTLSEDKNGIIWVGTYGNGLLRYGNGKIKQINTVNGLSNDYISSSFFDKEQNVLWIGTMYGVSKIQLDNKSSILSIKNYLNESNRENYGCIQNAITKLINGTILLSVGDELFEFKPDPLQIKKNSLKLQISSIKVNRKGTIKLKNNASNNYQYAGLHTSAQLKFDQNNLEFTFNTIDFHSPQTIKYSWILDGNDNNWIPFVERNYATYTNLPYGKYSLKVKAINQSGEKSSIIIFPFVISKPYYLEWWFITLSIGIPFLLLVWFVKYRINKIKKVESERTENYKKLAESELKALRAQMNPHFMFNTLNAIQEVVLSGDDEKSRIYFADFAKMMRMILINSTEKMITLEREIEFIQLYLMFEKVRFQNKFQVKFEIDSNIETHSIRIPGMLLQPLIENAINHGLLHQNSGGLLEISFFEKRVDHVNYLYCVIQDNGIGFNKSEELNQWKTSNHRSISSSISKERIEILNSLYGRDKFRLILTDLNNSEGITGTKVELIIAID